jgi:hypothetical protein
VYYGLTMILTRKKGPVLIREFGEVENGTYNAVLSLPVKIWQLQDTNVESSIISCPVSTRTDELVQSHYWICCISNSFIFLMWPHFFLFLFSIFFLLLLFCGISCFILFLFLSGRRKCCFFLKYIKIIFFYFFKINFLHQYIKTIQNFFKQKKFKI